MFALGRRSISHGVLDQLKAFVRNPFTHYVPLLRDMDTRGVLSPSLALDIGRFSAQCRIPETIEMSLLEQWVDAYMLRQRWDFAWALILIAYTGSLETPSMDIFQWDGAPGASRLWLWVENYLLPLPVDGPLRGVASNWFGLSGGFYAPSGRAMSVDSEEFLLDWKSPNSPLVLYPMGGEALSPDDALMIVAQAFHDKKAYPAASLDMIYGHKVDGERKGDVIFRGEIPVTRACPYSRNAPSEWEGPWDLEWLEGHRGLIPKMIYEQAVRLRLA